MKNIVIIILVLLSPTIFAQDTTFFDKSFRKVSSINQCNTYQICTRNEVDTNKALLETFYKSGQIKSRSATLFIDNLPRFNGGLIEEWYENGQLQRKYFFQSAISLHGEVFTYHKDGSIKRNEMYDDGVLIKGKTFNSDGLEVPYTDFIIPASFPGGNNELMGFLLRNIKYPSKLLKKGIGGTVLVQFMIDTDGSIKDASIHKSIHDLLDKEALRVVRKMPNWAPQIFDGESIATYFLLPVAFRITGE